MHETLPSRASSSDTFELNVKAVPNGTFGVFANSILILEHGTQAQADAHCQRLRVQQAADTKNAH